MQKAMTNERLVELLKLAKQAGGTPWAKKVLECIEEIERLRRYRLPAGKDETMSDEKCPKCHTTLYPDRRGVLKHARVKDGKPVFFPGPPFDLMECMERQLAAAVAAKETAEAACAAMRKSANEGVEKIYHMMSGACARDILRQWLGMLTPNPGQPYAEVMRLMQGGAGLIAAERDRQRTDEGYDAKHDARHQGGELRDAAICYIRAKNAKSRQTRLWPWDGTYWNPKDKLRNLVRAGALLAAEIDRLEQAAKAAGVEQPNG